MQRTRAKAAVVLGLLGLTACAGTTPKPPVTLNDSVVGPAGGTLNGQGDVLGAQLNVPAGALSQDTPLALGLDPSPPEPPIGYEPAGPPLLLSPEGLTFHHPATVLVPFRGLSNVKLFSAPAIPGEPWTLEGGGVADAARGAIRAPLSHFSRYRAFRLLGTSGTDGG